MTPTIRTSARARPAASQRLARGERSTRLTKNDEIDLRLARPGQLINTVPKQEPSGRRNGRFTTGRYTQEVIGLRQLVAILAREARIVCEEIE
jgi:hypothetical protein